MLQFMGSQRVRHDWATELNWTEGYNMDIRAPKKNVFLFEKGVSSVSCSVVSNSLWPHIPQHTRPPCPSPTPRVYLNSCPLRQWCHLTISSSVIPFFSCPQSFPAWGSFPMFFASDGQGIGISASASVLPMNIQDWFPFWIDWLDLLAVQGTLKGLLQPHSSKASILWHSAFFMVWLLYPNMTTGKTTKGEP